jgi:hypothetical protein
MLPDHLGHFARVHQRSVALVRHVLRNDPGAAAVLVSEVERTDTAQIVSLAQLCGLLLAQMPVEQRDSLLNKAATTLAAGTDCLRLSGTENRTMITAAAWNMRGDRAVATRRLAEGL